MDRSHDALFCTTTRMDEFGYEGREGWYEMAYVVVHKRARQDFVAKTTFLNTVLYVVGDGHGVVSKGEEESVRVLFLDVLQSALSSLLKGKGGHVTVEDVKECLFDAHQELVQRHASSFRNYGICLSFVWLVPDRNVLFVFQHGDNFVFIKEKRSGEMIKFLDRHSITNVAERNRIGSFYFMGEEERYNGILAVTRSIGDLEATFAMKSPRTHLFPEAKHLDVFALALDSVYFICLASDGIDLSRPENLLPLLDSLRNRNFGVALERLEKLETSSVNFPADDQSILYLEFS